MTIGFFTALIAASVLTAPPVAPGRAAKGTYLYALSDNTGPVASSWASVVWDAKHKELYVVDREDGTVGVFNAAGMEIYRFGQDSSLGLIIGIAVLENGDLVTLGSDNGNPVVWRCNFRGEPKQRIEPSGMPGEFADGFWPDVIASRAGKLFLAQRGAMKVLVTDLAGKCLSAHDYYREMHLDQVKTARGGIPAMQAFNVDAGGTILFTVAPLFKAFMVSPEGKVTGFGERGGSPGRFNIVGGIARDERGNVLVTDVLRSVVMVFTPELEFLGEFGSRGWGAAELIAPLQIDVGDGQVFVSQSARRGVSVFRYEVPPPPPPPAPDAPPDGGAQPRS